VFLIEAQNGTGFPLFSSFIQIGSRAIFKLIDARQVSSMPLSQIIEIPDVSLNEKLIPANDNHNQTALSMESFEAGSILAQRDYTKPSRGALVITAVFCLIVLAAFIVRLAI
jgi:hypothetical protein